MRDQSLALTVPRIATASLHHYWRVSLALVLGVTIATSVIVGALLVGDSMRGSLRALTLDRLGRIDTVLFPGSFFEPTSVMKPDVTGHPALLFPAGVAETPSDSDGGVRRAGSVQILGVDDDFWSLDNSGNAPQTMPGEDDVVLNQACADELGVSVGDLVTIRLPVESAVPADSPLGRRDAETEGLPRLKVIEIIDNVGLGRFSLAPSQVTPQNVFLNRATIASALDREGQANAMFFDRSINDSDLTIGLSDLGVQVKRVKSPAAEGSDPASVFDYYSVTSERLLLDDKIVDAIRDALSPDKVVPVNTYLANAIETIDDEGNVLESVPYSIVSGIDSQDDFPLDYALNEDAAAVPLVVNEWTASRLKAQVGDSVRLAYFEPEVERGQEIERYFNAIVTGIVPITEPVRPFRRTRPPVYEASPTVYNDPDLTPTVPGVTDQDSISDWDTPFPLTRPTDQDDDAYWKNHRLTPKAFVPLENSREKFASRFGRTTGLRIDSDVATDLDTFKSTLRGPVRLIASELGWNPLRIRQQQLDASRGTTPFDGLFLSLSFFVIAAAMMLIAMLFRLGLQSRLKELGTLIAIGWNERQVSRLLLREGMMLAVIGVVLGIAGGFAYAWLVLAGLRSYWVGAVTVPFLEFHYRLFSLCIGGSAGFAVALGTLYFSIRSLTKSSAISLLRGESTHANAATDGVKSNATREWAKPLAVICLVVALGIAGWGTTASGTAAAGGFVGAGMLLLFAGVLLTNAALSSTSQTSPSTTTVAQTQLSFGSLSMGNARRNPLRSTLTIGLMSCAVFLILAMAAFQLQPDEAGTGGFDLIGTTAQPVYRDLADPAIRQDWLANESEELSGLKIVAMRQRRGQDASCNNLYQASQPTVLGVAPESLAGEESTFAWAGAANADDPWSALETAAPGTQEAPIPVVIDQNTAMWSLQLRGGVGQDCSFTYDDQEVFFRVVGLLSNTVLQGQLLISEDNFRNAFPGISGYSKYLIRGTDPSKTDRVASVLESRLGDVGMDLSPTREVLAGMMSVQNTYLKTFQSLGTLGLLLGTIGLAIAQLRTVLERRQELAVMRAIGFSRASLAKMVMQETLFLLVVGLGLGAACAVLAVLPYGWLSGLKPPIADALPIVAGILLFGCLAGLLAVVRVVRMPLLDSLRGS